MNGGEIVARTLSAHGVDVLFTLIGGHIAPILVESKKQGIRVIDTRHEATAVFAADAWARLKGIPGVAVVTAGPGVTNTITAVRNALMAESPLVLIGGATATVLRGRGSLQDIDQMALMRSNVKRCFRATRVQDIALLLTRAFAVARENVPGPVFVELPVDLLYDEKLVREWYAEAAPHGKNLAAKLVRGYLKLHTARLFRGAQRTEILKPAKKPSHTIAKRSIEKIARALAKAERPLILAGSQLMRDPARAEELRAALLQVGIPTYLSGMARGLLGENSPLLFRHRRKEALKECDLVLLLGVPADFRLNYGAHIHRSAYHISVHLDRKALSKNKRPDLALCGDPGTLLLALREKGVRAVPARIAPWLRMLAEREKQREHEIERTAAKKTKFIHPVEFLLKAAPALAKKTILVADGGDFVATAAYILRPGGPLTWLDPGVFGTLGVGAGFALGAKLARPDDDVVILYGDGSAAYSLMEFDTFQRHKIPIGAIIGNDACWSQIYRDQITLLKDDVACMLDHSHYEQVAKIFGGSGLTISKTVQIAKGLSALRGALKRKQSFILNVLIGESDFRKGSLSM